MTHKQDYILGLDIGTNSIGWAIVDCEKESESKKHKGIYAGYKPTSLCALNSRIFLEMVEADTKVPKNQARRNCRGARNRRAYYKKRRRDLIKILIAEKLLPDTYQDEKEQTLNDIDRKYAERKLGKEWSKKWTVQEKAFCSPYAMRNFSLEEKLEPYEFGRLLLHLQRRRGYFSNRGAKYVNLIKHLSLETPKDDTESMEGEEKKETGKVLSAISELIKELNDRTLGQFIWQESQQQPIPPQRITLFEFKNKKKRKGETETVIEQLQFRAEREMYEQEFDSIWEKQNSFHKISEEQAAKIKAAIFHQRPLQLQKNKVGSCNIYPRKKRAPVMRLECQEHRTLQVINNIKIDGTPLDAAQRQQLIELSNNLSKLNDYGRVSKGDVAKKLGVKQKDINYNWDSDDGKTGLIGNKTTKAICESIGADIWNGFSKERQTQLVEDLLTIHDKKALYDRLVTHWKLPPYTHGSNLEEGALGLAMNERLESGYGKHSLKAINEMLPHLREGKNYYEAVEEIGRQGSITKEMKATADDFQLRPQDVPNIANPIVQKALYEIRRVVNTIVKQYGKPAIIRMEMAREMKASKKHRVEIIKEQTDNRKRNEEAEKEILNHHKQGNSNVELKPLRNGVVWRVSRKDRQKYKMWKYEQDERCPYCQKHIGFNELFSGEAEEEHILPRVGFSQNYMNTVVSCRTCNDEKGKHTPYEMWGADKERWGRIEKFAKEHYKGSKESKGKKGGLLTKRRNILRKDYKPEDENEFVTRQLNDTRYIATATKAMLEQYGVPVDVNTGAATAELRRKLGLNNVLPRKPNTSAYVTADGIDTQTDKILQYSADKANKKSRQDHRHHAVDAFVIAITDRAMIKAMVDAHQKEQDDKNPPREKSKEEWIKEKRLCLPKSWQDDSTSLCELLRTKLNATVVSHMAKRKVWGGLHEDTRYGESHFDQQLDITGMRATALKQVEKLASAKDGDIGGWIENESLRAMLLDWSQKTRTLKPKDRLLPSWGGVELKQFSYQISCVTVRKELGAEILSKLNEDWQPGTGTWVAEKSVHNNLYKWLEINDLLKGEEKTKRIKEALKTTPPRIRNKKGNDGAFIKRVKLCRAMTDTYRKLKNSYVKPGSNHHFVLFHNGKEGEERKRKCTLVTMLEAAKRASVGKPIIVKEPPPEWEGEWHYELDLCVNDMVECLDLSIFDDEEKFASEHRNTPYFRLQMMSPIKREDGISLNLVFRHHSISEVKSESKWGLWHIQSLNNIQCKKVQLGNLGGEMRPDKLVLFTSDSDDS